MENNIEEKLNMEAEFDRTQKELKNMLGDLDIAKKEKSALDSMVEKNKRIIEEQNDELKRLINDIATQRLEWLQQKATEEENLANKNLEVDKILNRKIELDAQEAQITRIHEEVKDVRNQNAKILIDIEDVKTATQAIRREIESEKEVIRIQEVAIVDKIKVFKQGVEGVIKELSKIQ